MTLHLLADCTNSHKAEVTLRPALRFIFYGQPGEPVELRACMLLLGMRRGWSVTRKFGPAGWLRAAAHSLTGPAGTSLQPGLTGLTLLNLVPKSPDICWSFAPPIRVFKLSCNAAVFSGTLFPEVEVSVQWAFKKAFFGVCSPSASPALQASALREQLAQQLPLGGGTLVGPGQHVAGVSKRVTGQRLQRPRAPR